MLMRNRIYLNYRVPTKNEKKKEIFCVLDNLIKYSINNYIK